MRCASLLRVKLLVPLSGPPSPLRICSPITVLPETRFARETAVVWIPPARRLHAIDPALCFSSYSCRGVVAVLPKHVFLARVSFLFARHQVTEPNKPGIRKALAPSLVLAPVLDCPRPSGQTPYLCNGRTHISIANTLERTLATKDAPSSDIEYWTSVDGGELDR